MSSILLLDAGGTIASRPDARGVLVAGEGAAGLRDLLAPELQQGVVERHIYGGLSEDMSLADAMTVVRSVHQAIAEGATGVVVTHGTDTMEEVCFLTDLFLNAPVPVVFTGAQRAASVPGCDGPANLHDAVLVARDPRSCDIGAVIVFGGRILPARSARKLDSSGPEAFGPHGTALGRVDDHGVRLSASPRRPRGFALVDPDPNVETVALGVGSNPRVIDALVDQGIRGLVIEGFGRGNVAARLIPSIERAQANGVLVGIATSCIAGGTAPSYQSGAALADVGAIGAEDLSAKKLRLLFSVALGGGNDAARARQLVADWLKA